MANFNIKYKGYITLGCYDKYINCFTVKDHCSTPFLLNGENIKTACPQTCGTCKDTQF